MPKDLELLKEPKFKKTPKERKQDKYGYGKGDFEVPTIGLMGMGATAAAGAAYDKGKKLNKKYKKEADKKKETKIKQGKPKIAKKGWK
jgi:hypothetical protein